MTITIWIAIDIIDFITTLFDNTPNIALDHLSNFTFRHLQIFVPFTVYGRGIKNHENSVRLSAGLPCLCVWLRQFEQALAKLDDLWWGTFPVFCLWTFLWIVGVILRRGNNRSDSRLARFGLISYIWDVDVALESVMCILITKMEQLFIKFSAPPNSVQVNSSYTLKSNNFIRKANENCRFILLFRCLITNYSMYCAIKNFDSIELLYLS